ncbi:hypothetical protein [Streptomyces sp. HPF1205]|uniref:hypothetical protein n=1 Tax=Streptomyces sp. HPF1205 TaxID=2873262 RepID=UPI001CED54BC|nr:hypothetical protein [Streptomyces sp. HPF1205]
MRFRHTAVAAACALAAVLVLPGSARAADGTFSYSWTGLDGTPHTSALTDPPSHVCLTLPEVADPSASGPADTPRNDTGATATVFTDPDCQGAYFTLRPDGGHASARLKLRSVVFSES